MTKKKVQFYERERNLCVCYENDFTNAMYTAEHIFPLKFKQLICVNRVFESLMANPLDSTTSGKSSVKKLLCQIQHAIVS